MSCAGDLVDVQGQLSMDTADTGRRGLGVLSVRSVLTVTLALLTAAHGQSGQCLSANNSVF